jgi:hypothetical protein
MAKADTNHTITRRSILGAATVAAVAQPFAISIAGAVPPEASGPNAQILALETEIHRLFDEAAQINLERVDPFSYEFEKLAGKWHRSRSEADLQAMRRFGEETGRDAAIDDADKFYDRADVLIRSMWAMPAQTNAGRAAKVRVFFEHVAGDFFKGQEPDLDWDAMLGRKLLLEYAGMNEADAVMLTGAGIIEFDTDSPHVTLTSGA